MLKNITLNNFKKHKHLKIAFDEGVSCVRGQNAVGKSTVLKAIGFALFGASAAGAKDHLKTWGVKEPMSVELTLDLPDYPSAVITRTEKNAKVFSHNGQLLASGHTPVTAFIEEQLGLAAKDLRTLMISPQGETQGLLDLGAAALEKRVSEIAKSHIIDKVLSLISIDTARIDGELEGIGEVQPIAELQARMGEVETLLEQECNTFDSLTTSRRDLQKQAARYDADLRQALQLKAKRAGLEASLQVKQQELQQTQAAWGETQALLSSTGDLIPAETVDRLKQRIAEERQVVAEGRQTRSEYIRLGREIEQRGSDIAEASAKLPESNKAEEVVAELESEVRPLQVRLRNLQSEQAVLASHVQMHRKALNGSICPTCKREYEPGSKEKAEADLLQQQQALDAKTAEVQKSQADLDGLMAELAQAKALVVPGLREYISKLEAGVAKAEQEFETLTLRGDPTAALSAAEYQLEMLEEGLEQVSGKYQQQQVLIAKAESLVASIEARRVDLESAQLELDNLPSVPGITALEEVINAVKAAQSEVEEQYEQVRARMQDAKTELALLQGRLEEAEKAIKRRSELEHQGAGIKELQSYLRKNRGRLMADTWDALLNYTSALVSSVTEGRLSGLSRTNGDFMIKEDDREIPCEELSGGQKSIVGICLRLALSQVFYGKGLTLLLDEPAADLADDMAAALSGMLRGLGHQVVMVTHRQGDASVADEVIEIGG